MSSVIFLFSLAAASSEHTRPFNTCDGSKENAERKKIAVVAPLHLHIGTPLINGYQFDNFVDAKKGIHKVIKQANKFLTKHLNFAFDVQSIKEYEHKCVSDPNDILDTYHDRESLESNEFHHLFTYCPNMNNEVVGLAATTLRKEDFCERGACVGLSNYEPLKEENHDTHRVHLMDAWRFLHEIGHNFGAIHETTTVEISGLMKPRTATTYTDSSDTFYKKKEADFTLDAENKCYMQKMINHSLKEKYAGFQEVGAVEKEETDVIDISSPDETDEEDTDVNVISPSETDEAHTDVNVISPEETDEEDTDVDVISPSETDEGDTDVDVISPSETDVQEIPEQTPNKDSSNKPDSTGKPVRKKCFRGTK